MRTVYIANDGKEFSDEYDCKDYEFLLYHPCLKDVCFYDKEGERLKEIISDDTYKNVVKIVVPNEEAVNALEELVEYIGYASYDDISEPGTWVFEEDKERFVKQSTSFTSEIMLELAAAIEKKCTEECCPCRIGCHACNSEECFVRIMDWIVKVLDK